LNDTPEVYEAKQTKNVPLRKDIRRYLSSRERQDIIEDPEYTLSNINRKIPAADLQFLSIFDLYLTSRYTFESKDTSILALTSEPLTGNNANGRTNVVAGPRRSGNAAAKQASTAYSSNELEVYRNIVFEKLNDSVRIHVQVSIRALLTLNSW
jgi:hypothetical protein